MKNAKIIFLVGVIVAFIYPDFAVHLKDYLVPVLMVMMTFSIKKIGFRHIRHDKIKSIIQLVLINYVLLTGIYIVFAFMFIRHEPFRNSILVLGIMPPAVGIISLSYILNADVKAGFIAEFLGYLVSIFAIPLLSLLLFKDAIDYSKILQVFFFVVIIPFFVSRLIHHTEMLFRPISDKTSNFIITLMYSISFYIIIGLNFNLIVYHFRTLIPVVLMLITLKFGFGSLIYVHLKKKMKKSLDILYVLFGTMKNGGAATAIAFLLFGAPSTPPLAINAILTPFYIIFLEWFILEKLK